MARNITARFQLKALSPDPRLYEYVLANSLREHPSLRELRAESDGLLEGDIRTPPEQAQFLSWLVELTGARRVLEIGCFTGYSALAMALSLPPGGRLVTLDANEAWASIGQRFWRDAGVEGQIELRLGRAADLLAGLLAGGAEESFDFAYIDADKKRYDIYYESALKLVRRGGVIAIDNVLWGGAVADPDNRTHQAEALRALNAKLLSDRRISLSLLPIGDGLSLCLKR
jgi:predicted O-methyltransferase YrrM